MISVHIQVWGPLEGSGANYTWITIGVVETEEPNMEDLKKRAVEMVKKSSYTPTANMARLVFKDQGKSYMKATFLDLWD